ncbi:MAG: glycosyltransferase [Candidatus Dependentiae bacterium]|nr:glycosyltransferase [Candidatus Dependentiae bacterium]
MNVQKDTHNNMVHGQQAPHNAQVAEASVKKTIEQSKPFNYWLKKNKYYHQQVINFYRFVIPQGVSVLHVNCKNGYLLDAVKPSYGVGVDADELSIGTARERYANYAFYQGSLDTVGQHDPFDYVVLSLVTMETDDIQELLQSLRRLCHPGTRIIVDTYSYLWEPVLNITQKLGLRRPTVLKNWVSPHDLQNFLYIAGFEVVTKGRYMLMPTYIPLISTLCNAVLMHVPLVRNLCLNEWIIARPEAVTVKAEKVTVSVIVPCRNEKGNIEAAVLRCPEMGASTEIIFVEGNSKDGTLDEIKRVCALYPHRNVSWYVQDGKGKGDAVRKGFAHATGDILMILDADLTAPPEELPKFVDALVSGKGEFINGSRLIYGMESEAMRFLNLLANFFFGKLFSWLLDQKVKDTLCGTKVLWARDYKNIVANRHFFGDFDPFGDFDLLFGAAKLNLKIIDMPVHYKNRTYGSTQIHRFTHGLILLSMSMLALKKFKIR